MAEMKTYRADSMHEALSLVRRELGPEALILHTRQITRKPRLPWQKEKVETEIVAVREEETRSETIAQRPGRRATPVAATAPRSAVTPDTHTAETRPAPEPVRRNVFESSGQQTNRWSAPDHEIVAETVLQPAVLQPAVESFSDSAAARVSETVPEVTPVVERESVRMESLIHERLDALQKMVEQLTRQVQSGCPANLPSELTEVYTQLLDAEVDEDLARELLNRLKFRCTVLDFQDPARIQRQLRNLLEGIVHCSGHLRIQPGRQKIVALVGPTGVGKTTTLAKLAANFRLRDHIRMGLITVDTYRIAAVEQLRTYAEIIDLPMRVVTTPEEMKRAVQDLAGMDLILIDTAGRSPQDDLRINELKTFLNEIVVDETHLVLSATTSPRQLKKTVEKFQPIHPSSVILTKLDEAPGAGAILNITAQLGLPLSYLTTGQNVPRDIEPAELSRAVRLILGESVIMS